MGNQGHTGEGMRLLKEWVQQGAIGTVKEIHVWTNRPIWPQGNAAKFETGKATPDTLDWEAWQAANPLVGYTDGLHPFAWRGHTLYGAGAMGDMGCHLLDGPFWALDLHKSITKDIIKVEVEAEEAGENHWPKASTIKVHFPNVVLTLVRRRSQTATSAATRSQPQSVRRRVLTSSATKAPSTTRATTASRPASSRKPATRSGSPRDRRKRSIAAPIPATHRRSGRNAIKNGLKCPSSFEYSVPLTYLCLLGNLAISTGKTIEFDPNKLEVVGMPEANKFIKRTYREGWEYSAEKI